MCIWTIPFLAVILFFAYLIMMNGTDYTATLMGIANSNEVAVTVFFVSITINIALNIVLIVKLIIRRNRKTRPIGYGNRGTAFERFEKRLTYNSIFLAIIMLAYLFVSTLIVFGLIDQVIVWLVLQDVFALGNPILLLIVSKTSRQKLFQEN